jgi:predicted phage gp36 major capsid-like protein
MDLDANSRSKTLVGSASVVFSMMTNIGTLNNNKTLNLGEFNKTKKSDFRV